MEDDAYKKRVSLYSEQKKLLETFLKNGAITKVQFEKSLHDLTVKMGMEEYGDK